MNEKSKQIFFYLSHALHNDLISEFLAFNSMAYYTLYDLRFSVSIHFASHVFA
jgi:hypothetical protein